LSLGELVLSLADNKQLLGLRYAEWATRAPSLEADIAAAGMGLDDLGHCRVLYGCLEPLGDDPRPGLARDSDPAAYWSLPYFDQPFASWSHFVAANAVLDTAFTALIQACVEGSAEVLQTRLRKMLMEERYHFLHGRSWLRSGIDRAPLDEAWRQAVAWFGPPGGELEELHRSGVLSMGPAELLARVSDRLGASPPKVAVDWKAWDSKRRREGAGGGIDERTFNMLRGLEEKRFMPAGA